eukprot:CAMPEP_0184660464 /NCGR_PEP_ID=MMETSP0308-20130426/34031_1 /TAXON_ID=38269 /ORGANISM="Gloeochaete witrockiana, Strain SAG 46.84" /LENGTH=476 /DNA_ID=CAMNT_0027101081 /DNA_START=260 /DNA_END=1690 /DNA_ORIENTATION=+
MTRPPDGHTLKEKIQVSMDDPFDSGVGLIVSGFLMSMIILSLASYIIQSLPEYVEVVPKGFYEVDMLCLVVFTLEFILRIAICTSFVKFFTDVYTYIDLISILTLVISVVAYNIPGGGALKAQDVLRLLRLARLVKLTRFFRLGVLLTETMKRSALIFLVLMYYLAMAVILFGSIMFYIERGTWDPDTDTYMITTIYGDTQESLFNSIPNSMWFTIVTLATVGYGDMYPLTTVGRIVGSILIIAGFLVIALPIGVIGSAFTEVIMDYRKDEERRLAEKKACKHYRRWSKLPKLRWRPKKKGHSEEVHFNGPAPSIMVTPDKDKAVSDDEEQKNDARDTKNGGDQLWVPWDKVEEMLEQLLLREHKAASDVIGRTLDALREIAQQNPNSSFDASVGAIKQSKSALSVVGNDPSSPSSHNNNSIPAVTKSISIPDKISDSVFNNTNNTNRNYSTFKDNSSDPQTTSGEIQTAKSASPP